MKKEEKEKKKEYEKEKEKKVQMVGSWKRTKPFEGEKIMTTKATDTVRSRG